MKRMLKNIVPKSIRKRLSEKRYSREIIKRYYISEIKHFMEYSNSYSPNDNENKLRGLLTMHYHVIEKGLTMPETRLGFGKERITEIVRLCNIYLKKGYDQSATEFVSAVGALQEYLLFHSEITFKLDPAIESGITSVISNLKQCDSTNQVHTSSNDFFRQNKADFIQFASSRRSCRHFTSKEISDDIIRECIDFARNTPSTCNTQANRIYYVKDEVIKNDVLGLQNGNRGFGDAAKAIFILTSDISSRQSFRERHTPYFDSGMYAMNLLYVLHYHEIAACPLNWNSDVEEDKKLRKIINIPKNEVVTLIIALGYPPEVFKIASSPRLELDRVFHTI